MKSVEYDNIKFYYDPHEIKMLKYLDTEITYKPLLDFLNRARNKAGECEPKYSLEMLDTFISLIASSNKVSLMRDGIFLVFSNNQELTVYVLGLRNEIKSKHKNLNYVLSQLVEVV